MGGQKSWFWFLAPGFSVWIGGSLLAAVACQLGLIDRFTTGLICMASFFLGAEINQRDHPIRN